MSRTTSELVDFKLNNKIFKAGAGAGKTTRLVREVYDYYYFFTEKNKKEPRVAITTFTRKATQELRERLMLFATLNDDKNFLDFVLSKNKLQISTIHGFLQILLRQYAQLLELDPGFSFVSDTEVLKSAKRILKEAVSGNTPFLQLLEVLTFNELARVSVRHSNNRLIYKNLSYPSFDDFMKIKKDIFYNLKDRYNALSIQIMNETTDAKWFEYAQNLKNTARLLGDNESMEVIQDSMGFRKPAHLKKKPQVSDQTDELCQQLKKDFDKLDVELFDDENIKFDVGICEQFHQLMSIFHEKFMSWKKINGKISLSDLESLSLQIIENFPLEIESFKNSYDYWLVDEYQDTSPVQVKLLDAMIGDRFRFVVGDPQQSIYFFRGARSEVFNDEIDRIKVNRGLFEDLNTNYRSSPRLMHFVNDFFNCYSTKFQKMQIGSTLESTESVAHFYMTSSDEEQAQAISKEIIKLLDNQISPSQIAIISRKNGQLRKISETLSKAKIPYIVHSAQGFQDRREILDALFVLKFLCIPFDNVNLIGLLRTPWFRLDDSKIIQIVKKEKGNYWQQFIKALESDSNLSPIVALKDYLDLVKELGVSAVFEKILEERGFFDLSSHLDSSGRRESNLWKFVIQLKDQDHKPGFNYIQFIEGHEKQIDLDSQGQDSDAISSLEPDRVNLMTVHMSKGLEFDYVFLPYIDSEPQTTKHANYLVSEKTGCWCLNTKGNKEESSTNLFSKNLLEEVRRQELAESDRLLYVSVTRAKKSLYFFSSGSKRNNSWLKNMQINLSEGVHGNSKYSYSVFNKDFEYVQGVLATKIKYSVRKPYSAGIQRNSLEDASVTNLVSKKQTSTNLMNLLESAQFGTQIHKLLETLKYQNEEIYLNSLDVDRERALNILNYIKNLNEVPLNYLLKNGYAEWGYITQEGGQKISGQVDLWGIKDNEVWIVDYKTGTSKFKDTAFEQLNTYAHAICKFTGIQKINLVALYPTEGKCFLELFRQSKDLVQVESPKT